MCLLLTAGVLVEYYLLESGILVLVGSPDSGQNFIIGTLKNKS